MARLRVCAEDELADGEYAVVPLGDGFDAAVFRIGSDYYAIEDLCSHDDGPLADGELDRAAACIACPRHGARFDLRTGNALSLPAYRPVATFPVTVADGAIWIDT